MRNVLKWMLAAAVLAALLTACSRENLQQIGLVGIETTFEVTPETAAVGEEVSIKAQFTGVELDEKSNVQIVVIVDQQPVRLEHQYEGGGTYTASYRFEQAGTYNVDLHLYYEDIHIYKKSKVEVQ